MDFRNETNELLSVLNGWRIVRTLSTGRNSRVFEIHRDFGGVHERGSLKVIRITDEQGRKSLLDQNELEAYRERLERVKRSASKEIRSLIKLGDCPFVMKYYDHSVIEWENDTGFGCDLLIRTELLKPLSNVQNNGPLPRAEVIRICEEIAAALEYCHKNGVIHRDIKPDNIFFNSCGTCKLGDFGIAAISNDLLNRASTAIGTPAYAAPEQFMALASSGYDERVDIYSLGMVLYELANANEQPLYDKKANLEANIRRRLAGEPLPKPNNIDAALWSIIRKACSFKPAGRFKTAADMRKMLIRAEKTQKRPCAAIYAVTASSIAAVMLVFCVASAGREYAFAKNTGKQLREVHELIEPSVTDHGDTEVPVSSRPNETPEASQVPLLIADELSIGDHVSIGKINCDGNIANGQEQLNWIVYGVNDESILLICQNSIKGFYITAADRDLGYEPSKIREWLNGEFYDTAFDEDEKSFIEGPDKSEKTNDHVTLPYFEEIKLFMETTGFRSYTFMQPTETFLADGVEFEEWATLYLLTLNKPNDTFELASFYPNSRFNKCRLEDSKGDDERGYAYGVCPVLIINKTAHR